MGLMEQAVAAAQDVNAQRRTAEEERIREFGIKVADEFAPTFDFGAVWLDRVVVVDYHKTYRNYGGHEWVRRERFANRLQVEDVVIGVTEKADFGIISYLVWGTCPNCQRPTHRALKGLHAWGETDDKRRAHRHDQLVRAIGEAMISTEHCTVCQAQPCESCGRSR